MTQDQYNEAFTAGRESMKAELLAGVEMLKPFGLFVGVRNDPPKTREFYGWLNDQTQTDLKCDLFTADQLRSTVAAAVLRKDAEIVRLTEERESWRRVCETITIERDALKAENERLRAESKPTCRDVPFEKEPT